MADEVVAKRYAAALVAVSAGREDLEKLLGELTAVRDSFRRVHRLEKLLNSPAVKEAEKTDLVDRVFKGRVDDRIHRFLRAIFRRRRIRLFDRIVRETRAATDRLLGRHRAFVRSAIELPDGFRTRLHATLERTTGHTLTMDYREDPAIVGGLHIRIDDKVLDARFSRTLRVLRDRLLADRLLMKAHGAPDGGKNP